VESTILDGHSNSNGVARYYLYMTNFSTSEYLMPMMFRARNLIENVSYTVEQNEGLYDVNFVLWIGRNSAAFVSSVNLVYDDGSGETSLAMVQEWNTYEIPLESLAPGANITFYIRVVTIYGDTFDTSEQFAATPGGGGLPIDPVLLAVIGGIGAVAIVVVVIVMKKRGT